MTVQRRALICALAALLPALSAAARDQAEEIRAGLEKEHSLEEKGDFRAAVFALRSLAKDNPNDGSLRLALGKLYLRLGDADSADGEWRQAAEKGIGADRLRGLQARTWLLQGDTARVLREATPPDGPPADRAQILAIRGEALMLRGRRQEAEAVIGEASKLASDLADVLRASAVLAISQGHLAEGEALVDKAIAGDDRDFDMVLLKASLREKEGDRDGALAQYDRALKLRPFAATTLARRAALRFDAGREAEALADLQGALKLRPKDPAALLVKAKYLAKQKKPEEAWNALQPAMQNLRGNVDAQFLAAALNLQLGHTDQTVLFAQEVLAKAPDNGQALRILAAAYLKLGDLAKAIPLIEKLHVQAPDDLAVTSQLAEAYSRVGRNEDVVALAEKAGKAADDPSLKLTLGIALLQEGDLQRAETVLEGTDAANAPVALTLLHMRSGDLDAALAAAEGYRAKLPQSPLPDRLVAFVQMAKKDDAAAEKSLKAALGKDANFDPAILDLVSLYLKQNRLQEAEALLDALLKRKPGNERAQIAQIEIAWRARDLPKAIKLANDAVAAAPSSIGLAGAQISLLLRAGRLDAADAAAQRLVSYVPNKPESYGYLSSVQLANFDLDGAIASQKRVIELLPGSGPARLGLAQTLLKQKRLDESRAALDEAVRLSPMLLPAWQMLLADEIRRNGAKGALALAKSAGGMKGGGKGLADLLTGDVLAAADRYPEAVTAYRAAYDSSPTLARQVVPRLHAALVRAGKASEANVLVTGWLAKHPEDEGARLVLAGQHMSAKEPAAAIQEYETVLQSKPDSIVALNNLANLYGPEQQDKAIELARRAVELEPGSPAILDTYGWLLVRNGRSKDALAYLNRAHSSLSNKNPEISYHLAYALANSGDAARAIEVLRPLQSAKFAGQADARELYKKLGGN